MSAYLDRAHELRNSTDAHYNCAQAVLVPFAEAAGMSLEDACAVAQAFGGGMQTGNVCGAITGGLMALGVIGAADRKTVMTFFRRMREIFDGIKDIPFQTANIKYLSMGMSHDYEIAIEEGANIVRVGTAIFGPRQY